MKVMRIVEGLKKRRLGDFSVLHDLRVACRVSAPRRFRLSVCFGLGLAVLLVTAGGLLAQQAAAPPLTLAAARERADIANPTIVAARLQRAVDIDGVDVAKERPNPDLLFEAESDTPRESF